MISFDNIITTHAESLKIEKPKEKTIELISHGHFDHLPTKFSDRLFVCSEITKKMIELRKKKNNIEMHKDKKIKMFDSGHSLGSKMFMVNDTLFTGDFNTEDRYCGKANSLKCSTLIVESTFGKPQYIFPKSKFVIKDFKDYVEDNGNVTVNAYSFGKSQEICNILEKYKMPFDVSENIKKINDHLGLKFKYYQKNAPVVLTRDRIPGYKRVALSGWAIDPRYQYTMGLDRAFVFSDHCDYPSLLQFIMKCDPEKIYTYHGFNVELANDLKKIGYDAIPILKGQKLLSDFT
jgi:putative mRNA 3-end processing factor